MSHDHVKRNVVMGALTSYLRIIVRMALGLVTFRLLYQGLNAVPEQFGFWSLLWAVFGYGILLDFGFGYSAQKRVAELSVKQEWPQVSRLLSTIFFFYLIMAAVAFAAGVALSGPLIDLFKVSAGHREEYRRIMIVFLAGIGLAFPFGIFPEVLQGQQRMSTANNINILGTVTNFLAVAAVIYFKLSFMTLIVASLVCVLLPYLLAMKLALEHMPGVKLRPGLFSFHTMFETGRFSVFAYANTLSNVVRNKTDQPIISSILGVASVTVYQGGSKVGEMFGLLTKQIAEVLTPTAAHLHAKGDSVALREMMLGGLRYSVLAATPLFIVTEFYMDGVIRLLTGTKHPTAPMIWAGELLVFWYYSLVLTHWVFKNMFMMAGQEKRLMQQSVSEAAANVSLSIGLTYWLRGAFGVEWGILGVALGSVVPTFLFGWVLIWGWTAHEARLTRWQLFRRAILPNWRGCLPMIAAALALRRQPFWSSGNNTLLMLAESSIVATVGAIGIWRFSLTENERQYVADKFGRKLGFKAKAMET
ncbi:MAG: oligosaccharide flippase family protein [Verrucomicrobiota bacterium]